MFRFHGGQPVKKGTYWNLSSGEKFDAGANTILPGARSEHYVKLPALSVFIAGPLAGLLFTCIIPFLFIFVLLTFLPRSVFASEAVASDEAKGCLACHETPGMTVTFRDKDTLSVHVDGSHFKNTVHGFVSCTGCHSSVSSQDHPGSQYATKQEFVQSIAGACKGCHADEQIMANPLHQRAIGKANAPPCSDCHGSHAIRKVPTQKEKQSATQYCLNCHKQQLSLSLNGKSLSLSIDEAVLRKSVHSKHSCTDCHATHSKTEHPKPVFKSIRDVSISVSDACKRCHADKWAQHRGSIHYNLIAHGNQQAPVCSDCHGSHAVGRKALAETLQGVPCKKCHSEIFKEYEGSVHGKAKTKGNGSAPICSSCHFAHDIKPAFASRSPKDMCFGCHADVVTAHKEWLPNAEAHFDSVACTACHVPGEFKRSVYLRLTDKTSGKMLTDSAVKNIMGKTSAEGHVEPDRFWDIYQKLNDKGAKVALAGTVSLDDAKHAHSLLPKGKAIRQCEYCHTADAESFKTVSMTTARPDGTEMRYSLDSATLGSVYAMLPLGQFYALGSTRIWIMDVLGAAMIAGGLGVPALHATVRFITKRRRSRNGHGRKESKP